MVNTHFEILMVLGRAPCRTKMLRNLTRLFSTVFDKLSPHAPQKGPVVLHVAN